MTVADTLRDWPVDYVEEYVLERIVGNSDRPATGWAADRVKGTVGLVAIAVLSTLADTIMLHRAPRRWPWIAIAATPPLLAFVSVIVPTFVLPLFNTYVPGRGRTGNEIRALAARYGVGNAQILRFDMSRQSKKANAFVTGVFGTERIAIADTLVEISGRRNAVRRRARARPLRAPRSVGRNRRRNARACNDAARRARR